MNESNTVDVGTSLPLVETTATGEWGRSTRAAQNTVSRPTRLGVVKTFVFTLMLSPATSIRDTWYEDHSFRASVTAVRIMERAIGRAVSRREALTIARQVLELAEDERLRLADIEASYGIQWGEEE